MSVWSVAGMGPRKHGSGCRRGKGLLVAFALVAALSGCKVFVKDEPPPCPRLSILAETASLTRFASGHGDAPADMVVHARLTNYTGSCKLDADTHRMSVNVALEIDAERGPAMVGDTVTLPYFVAVPAFFPEPPGKQLMSVTLRFPSGASRIHHVDDPIYVSFPVVDQPGTEAAPGIFVKDLARYEVFVGWQLDPAELAYNRKQREKL